METTGEKSTYSVIARFISIVLSTAFKTEIPIAGKTDLGRLFQTLNLIRQKAERWVIGVSNEAKDMAVRDTLDTVKAGIEVGFGIVAPKDTTMAELFELVDARVEEKIRKAIHHSEKLCANENYLDTLRDEKPAIDYQARCEKLEGIFNDLWYAYKATDIASPEERKGFIIAISKFSQYLNEKKSGVN